MVILHTITAASFTFNTMYTKSMLYQIPSPNSHCALFYCML